MEVRSPQRNTGNVLLLITNAAGTLTAPESYSELIESRII